MEKEAIQELAEFMHKEYERYAQKLGWKTQKECQVAFEDLPEANKKTMLFVAENVRNRFIFDLGNMWQCKSCRRKNENITNKYGLF